MPKANLVQHRPVTRALARRINEFSKPDGPGSPNPTTSSSIISSIPALPLVRKDEAEKQRSDIPTHTDTVILSGNNQADEWRRKYIEEHAEVIEIRTWTEQELKALEIRDAARAIEKKEAVEGIRGEAQSSVKSERAPLGQQLPLSSRSSSTSMYEVQLGSTSTLMDDKLGKKGDSEWDVPPYQSMDLPKVSSYHEGGRNFAFGRRVLAECVKAEEEESTLAKTKRNPSRGF